MEKTKILQAGEIAKQVREFIEPKIKKGTPLLEIAELIENKIVELKGKPAFPTNLSINEIAAHYTPIVNDQTKAHGLLKIDFGVHVDGFISDTAFSVDLENSELNKKLIEASKTALENVLKKINKETRINEIGIEVEKTINKFGFNPIINLSGHGLEQYDLHAEITIPNHDDLDTTKIGTRLCAIEPFATNGNGKIHDGIESEIFALIDDKTPRSNTAREILNFIIEEYQQLPFCTRWLIKEFGSKALIGIRELNRNGNLHNFPQLVETTKGIVSQAEHTILIEDNEVIITTK